MNFELVGKLKIGQESEKFKPYQERVFDSGWMNRTLFINAICGDNRHMLQIQGGTFPDKKDYKILTFGPSTVDDSGQRHSGERVEILWKDRMVQSNLDKVAEFRKYTVDLEEYGRRRLLENFAQKIREGTSLTDEELQSVGLTSESEVSEALEKSYKKKHEFLSPWDQAEFMKKVLDSGKYNDKKFYVRGVYTSQWSDQKQQWYTNMTPQRIYLAKKDAEDYSKGTATIYFTENAVDDGSLEEKHKYYVNAFTMEYDSTRKKNIPCPFQLVIPEEVASKSEKSKGSDKDRAKKIVEKFVVEDDSVFEYGVEFNILDGAQRMEITPDMLTEEQQEELDLGLITIEELRRDLGGSVYGERVRENRYSGVARGYSQGRKPTAYKADDLVIPPLEDVTEGLFDDDDDDL